MKKQKTKILYLITGLKMGGAEKLLLQTLQALDKDRFEPSIAALFLRPDDKSDFLAQFAQSKIPVHAVSMNHHFDFLGIMRLWMLIRKEKPQIIHTHLHLADLLGRVVGKLCKVPVIVSTLHMVEVWRKIWPLNWIDGWTTRANDFLIAVSAGVRDGIAKLERIHPKKITVFPNSILFAAPDQNARATKRALFNLPEDAKLMGIVSRLEVPRKGHREIFEAFHQIKDKHPHLYCLVIGDGPARGVLEEKVKTLGLVNRVFFVGMQQDVPSWLASLDYFVLPSHLEGSPLALIEAMAAGLPVITTSVGGNAELIEHHKTGLLIPARDRNALAHAMTELLQNSEQAKALGDQAKIFFEEHLNLKNTITHLEALYEQTLERKMNPKYKILEVVTSFDRGGVTTYLEDFIAQLKESGKYEVTFACGQENLEAERLNHLEVDARLVSLTKAIQPFQDLKAILQLVRLIRKKRFDIVHTHMAKADWVAGLAAKLCGVKCILSTAHGATLLSTGPSLSQKIFDVIEAFTYQLLHHHVVGVSCATSEHLIRKRAVSRRKVTTIPNGISLKYQSKAKSRQSVRDELGFSSDQLVVTMVGRLKYPKTPLTLLESIKILSPRWPHLVCLLAGEGPEMAELEAFVRKEKLERFVRLLGHREDVENILHASDLFVLSSDSEGLSLSLLEAMRAKLPVIASRVGGNQEIIVEEKTGLLVAPSRASRLSAAIETLLESSLRRQEMGEAAFARIQKYFDSHLQVKKTCELFERYAKREQALAQENSSVDRLLNYYHEEGLKSTLRRIVKFLISPIWRAENLWILKHDIIHPVPQIRVRIPFEAQRATLEDLDDILTLDFESSASIRKRLESKQDVCFLARNGSELMGVQWVRLGKGAFTVEPFHFPIPLGPTDAYLFNSRSKREYRAQGIMPALELQLIQWLRDQGYQTVYTDILESNETSLSSIQKIGFYKVEKVCLRKWLLKRTAKVLRLRRHFKAEKKIAILRSSKTNLSMPLQYVKFLSGIPLKTLVIEHKDHFKKMCQETGADPCQNKKVQTLPFFSESKLSGIGFFQTVFRLAALFKRERIELIHCEDVSEFALARWVRLFGPSTLLTVSLDEKCVSQLRSLSSGVLQSINGFMVSSQALFDRLAQERDRKSQIISQKAILVDPAISAKAFNGAMTQSEAQKLLRIKKPVPMIGALLPLNSFRDFKSLLDLSYEVSQKNSDCEFMIAGDGPLFYLSNQYAKALGIHERVHFLRRNFDPKSVLKALSIVLKVKTDHPSFATSLEAAASGKMVVPLDLRAEEDLELSEELASSVSETADHLINLLSQPDYIHEMGQKAQENVREDFQAHYFALRIAEQWSQLLDESFRRVKMVEEGAQ